MIHDMLWRVWKGGLNESFVFRAWSGFSFAGAKHHQKKSLITFLAVFGSPFYVLSGARR